MPAPPEPGVQPGASPASFLPDFCTSRAVLAVLLITQLVAMLLVLAGRLGETDLWQRLLLLSLYLHWIGLCSAAVLCQARRWLAAASERRVIAVSYGLLVLVTLVISETAWQVAQWRNLQGFLPDDTHPAFLLRNLSICAIVAAMVLRYFWLLDQWRRQLRAEATARYQALQARIRPHFLFNSLNSIAALIGSRPQAAETAVEDLAQLFRAGLAASDRRVLLQDELEVTRAYLRTEGLRLGARLGVDWEVAADALRVEVPPLCLQPLLENAVIHGIEPRPEGGRVRVQIRCAGGALQIEVSNPLPAAPAASGGSGLALDNIRQRLRHVYGDAAELAAGPEPGGYRARLRIPLVPA